MRGGRERTGGSRLEWTIPATRGSRVLVPLPASADALMCEGGEPLGSRIREEESPTEEMVAWLLLEIKPWSFRRIFQLSVCMYMSSKE